MIASKHILDVLEKEGFIERNDYKFWNEKYQICVQILWSGGKYYFTILNKAKIPIDSEYSFEQFYMVLRKFKIDKLINE